MGILGFRGNKLRAGVLNLAATEAYHESGVFVALHCLCHCFYSQDPFTISSECLQKMINAAMGFSRRFKCIRRVGDTPTKGWGYAPALPALGVGMGLPPGEPPQTPPEGGFAGSAGVGQVLQADSEKGRLRLPSPKPSCNLFGTSFHPVTSAFVTDSKRLHCHRANEATNVSRSVTRAHRATNGFRSARDVRDAFVSRRTRTMYDLRDQCATDTNDVRIVAGSGLMRTKQLTRARSISSPFVVARLTRSIQRATDALDSSRD